MLRPYQLEAGHAASENIRRGVMRNLIVLPTGSGKMVIATELAKTPWESTIWKKQYLTDSTWRPVAFLVHRDELVFQAAEKMVKYLPGVTVGIEKAEMTCHGMQPQILVTSIQTMSRASRREQFTPERYWVMVDEAHHACSKQWMAVLDYFHVLKNEPRCDNTKPLIGFTATPKRGDGIGLERVFDAICYQKTMPDMMEDGIEIQGQRYGYLADFIGYRIQTEADISHVKTRGGDLDQKQLANEVNTPERNALVVRKYQQLGQGMSGLAFTVDIQHSEDLAKEFVRQGINCFPISSNTPKAVRRSVVQTFKTGDPNGFPVLTSCDALSEGFDAEIAAVGMGTRPTKSPVVFQQQVGRVARPYPSPEDYLAALRRGERPWKKPYAIWLDFCDQSGRHDLCSLPSLFGLRAGFDLKGKSAKETVRQIEKLEEENPGLDLGEVTDVSQIPRLLRSHTERINLFQTPIVAREIQALSSLGWIRTGPDRYQVSSPTQHTTYLVTLNLLGRYDVFASHVGVRRFLESFPDLREAIGFADTLVPLEDRTVLSTEMAWRSAPCTHKQVQLLWDRSYAVRQGFTDAAQLYRHFRKLHRGGNARFSRGGVSGMIDLVLHRNL